MPDLEELEERTIMPSLSDFKFASNDLTFAAHVLPSRNTPDEPIDFGNGDSEMPGAGEGPVEDFFTGGEAVPDFDGGFPGDGGGFDDDGDDDHGGEDMGDFTAANATGPNRTGPVEPFDPRRGRDERTLIMSMSEDTTEMLDYFDTTVMRNWAGPQHWKVRRAIRKGQYAGLCLVVYFLIDPTRLHRWRYNWQYHYSLAQGQDCVYDRL